MQLSDMPQHKIIVGSVNSQQNIADFCNFCPNIIGWSSAMLQKIIIGACEVYCLYTVGFCRSIRIRLLQDSAILVTILLMKIEWFYE